MKPVERFTLRFTREVTFRDMRGTVLKTFAPGDTCEATGTMTGYWITAWGGIFWDEAEKLDE